MSKPNLLAFSSSVGIYRNRRIQVLKDFLRKTVPRKVDFADLAPQLFQMVMAYAAENEIDGNFEAYTAEQFRQIFFWQDLDVSTKEASFFLQAFEHAGLFENGKIRSWMKYNRHLADYEGLIKAKRRAAKIMHKKREDEAKAALKKGDNSHSETAPEPEKNASKNDSPSKQLWLIEKALESAKGQARKELLAQKRSLLAESTGVDLSEAPRSPAPPAPKPRKQSPGEFERACLKNARELIAQDSADLMTEAMVRALHAAGDEIPQAARQRFPKLMAELGAENQEARNPVPG